MARPHTGRRRNEAVRLAILDAASELLMAGDAAGTGIDRLAAAAGVSKKTIYRWWPSKGAVLLEAMRHRAELAVPAPDTGSLRGDLRDFLAATFSAVDDAGVRNALATLLVEARADPHTGELLEQFTGERRLALARVVDRARERGELDVDTDPALLIDQAFGVLWYRLLMGRGALDADAALLLADGLADQVGC